MMVRSVKRVCLTLAVLLLVCSIGLFVAFQTVAVRAAVQPTENLDWKDLVQDTSALGGTFTAGEESVTLGSDKFFYCNDTSKNSTTQYVDFSFSGTQSYAVLGLRDQAPQNGALWGAGHGDAYVVFFDGNGLILRCYKGGQKTDLATATAADAFAGSTVRYRFEVTEAEGKTVIRGFYIDEAGTADLKFDYVDENNTISAAGGVSLYYGGGASITVTKFAYATGAAVEEPGMSVMENAFDYLQDGAAKLKGVNGSTGTEDASVFSMSGSELLLSASNSVCGTETLSAQLIDLEFKTTSFTMVSLRDPRLTKPIWTDAHDVYAVCFDGASVLVRRFAPQPIYNNEYYKTLVTESAGVNFADGTYHKVRIEIFDEGDAPVLRVFLYDDAGQAKLILNYTDTEADKLNGKEGGFSIASNADITIKTLVTNSAGLPDPDPSLLKTEDLLAEYGLLKYTRSGSYRFDTKHVKLGEFAAGNCSTAYYDYVAQDSAADQIIELSVYTDMTDFLEKTKDWQLIVYMRDQKAGAPLWETARKSYGVLLAGQSIILRYFDNSADGIDIGTLSIGSHIDWTANHVNNFRFEMVQNESGFAELRVFTFENDTYTFIGKITDKQNYLTQAGGLTIVGSFAADTYLSKVLSNVALEAKADPINLDDLTKVDFTDLLGDTFAWQGQIRSNNTGLCAFDPNKLTMLAGQCKNAGYVLPEGANPYQDFYIDFKLQLKLNADFVANGQNYWAAIFTFRDTSPTWNIWDAKDRNCYYLIIETNLGAPQGEQFQMSLRRSNNTSGGTSPEVTLAAVAAIDFTDLMNMRIATQDVENGVRICVWYNDILVIDMVDTDALAVKEGGSFMISQAGIIESTSIVITDEIVVQGIADGAYHETYYVGVNEPQPEGAQRYPQNVYTEPELEQALAAVSGGCGSSILSVSAAGAAMAMAGAVLLIKKNRRGEKK